MRRPLSLVLLCAAVLATALPATGQEPDRSHLDPAFLESIDDALLHGTVTPPGAPIEEKEAELRAYDDLVQGYPTLTEDELTSTYFKDGRFREVTDVARDYRPRADVRIVRDARWGVPHVYGDTDEAMAFGAGYAVVEDRLPIMELLRALGRAEAFELLGDNASWLADAEIARIYGYTEEEFQAMLDRIPAEYGQTGQDLIDGLVAYTEGINHAITQIQQGRIPQPAGLADLLPANDIAPWRPTDIVAVVCIVRALFGAGGGGELANAARWLDLVDTYGEEQARLVYDDFRNRTDDDGVVHTLDDFPYMTVEGGPRPTAANALGYSSGDTGLQGLIEQLPETLVGLLPTSAGAAAADLEALHEASRIRWENLKVEHPSATIDLSRADDARMSNYLVVDGERSSTGHPILLGGPQAGYFDPQILVENELHSPTIHARGAAFPGLSPVVIIGRNQSEAWTATAGGGDMIDTYIEVLCDPDGGVADEQEVHYLFEGECVPMDRRVLREAPEPIAGQEALPDIIVERTVHGPVTGRGRIGDLAVAVSRKRSTYLKELDAGVSILRMNRGEGRTARDFVEIFRESHNLSTNWGYANASEIAFVHGGLYPVRPTDLDPDFPVWGTGENEWETDASGEDRYLGVEAVPHEIDPERGYAVSWNNRQAPAWSANDSQWGYSALYRADLLEDQIEATGPGEISPVRLVQMMEQAGLADLRGTDVYPTALEVLRAAPAPSAREERMVELLEAWIADGALRRDGDGDGEYEHAAAIAIADAWWEPTIRAVFDPALGRGVDTVSRGGFHDAPGSVGSAFQDGFYGQVFRDLEMVLDGDVTDPTSQVYCGADELGVDGDLVTCAERLWAALAAAGDALAEDQGEDPDGWAADAAGERIRFLPTAVLSMHWVNRPTTQVLAMFGRGAGTTDGGGAPAGAPLPETGGGIAVLALGALGAAGALHRRRRG